jgi:hypothetical protein
MSIFLRSVESDADLCKNIFCLFPQPRDRAYSCLPASASDWYQHRQQTHGAIDIPPPAARRKLRMSLERSHIVNSRGSDIRLCESRHRFFCRQLRQS